MSGIAQAPHLTANARHHLVDLSLDDPAWIAFVESCPGALPFHHPSWSRVLAESYGYRPFVLARKHGDGRIAVGLPVLEVRTALRGKRWVSLPFTDVCPPLVGVGASPAQLLSQLKAARRQAGVRELEVRDRLNGENTTESSGVTHRLPLEPDPEAVLGRVKRSQVRRDIRKAEREGVQIRRGHLRVDVTETFYNLHLDTRRRLGVPVQPHRFFAALWQRVIDPGLGFVSIGYVRDVPVAAAIFLSWNGTMIYKYSASDPTYWHLHPNHLLLWDAIKWGCANGYRVFDFGRTETSNTGLRYFKSGWGASELGLHYSTLGEGRAQASLDRASKVIRPLIRRTPVWLFRLLGEVLYKYAG